MKRSLGVLCFALAVGTSGIVQAQDEAPQDEPSLADSAAMAHFRMGEAAYEDARFEEARTQFEEALELSGRPELWYNIGLANERLLRWEDTVQSFTRYLEEVPEAVNRDNVEARIRFARERLAEQTPDAEHEDEPVAPSRAGPLVLTIGGGAAAAAGGVLLGVGVSTLGDAEATPDGTREWRDVSGEVDRGNRLRNVGAVALSVGVAALVAGVIWWLSKPSNETRADTVERHFW